MKNVAPGAEHQEILKNLSSEHLCSGAQPAHGAKHREKQKKTKKPNLRSTIWSMGRLGPHPIVALRLGFFGFFGFPRCFAP